MCPNTGQPTFRAGAASLSDSGREVRKSTGFIDSAQRLWRACRCRRECGRICRGIPGSHKLLNFLPADARHVAGHDQPGNIGRKLMSRKYPRGRAYAIKLIRQHGKAPAQFVMLLIRADRNKNPGQLRLQQPNCALKKRFACMHDPGFVAAHAPALAAAQHQPAYGRPRCRTVQSIISGRGVCRVMAIIAFAAGLRDQANRANLDLVR